MKSSWWYRLSLLILLSVIPLSGQLKEFEIKEVEAPPGIPVFIDYPENAAVYIFSSMNNLDISSNLGLVADKSTPREGKYLLIVRLNRQILTVKAPGFKEGKIPLPAMGQRERKFYQVEELITDGTLMINSIPEGAEVLLNGTQYGFTPYEGILPEGDYEMILRKEMYHDKIDQIVVEPADTMMYTFRLTPKFGTLSLTSEPTGAEIFLDNNLVGKTPLKIEKVPSGDHEVYARLEFYEDVVKTVTIQDAQTTSDNIIMPKTQDALNLEKRARWKKFRSATMYSSIGAGAAGLGLKFLSDSKFEAYNNATSTAEATDLRKQVENFDLYTKIAVISCGTFAGWTLFNHWVVIKTPEPVQSVELSLQPTPNGIGLCMRF
ncbi:PEGA domain-containing protein [Fidelibacter multiformis]|uniref:PEGA domain-containing protein n=1 Tax=Fidelibacter multiformis TaxID=3377529 RepID=UPI0037DC2680